MSLDTQTNLELDDFIQRATQIHDAVKGLASGTIEPEQTNELLKEIDQRKPVPLDPQVEAYRKEQREKEEEALKRKGVKGQGVRPGYLYFCRQCFREFDLEPLPELKGKCANCDSAGSLITRAERMEELQSKVAAIQEHKAERAARRARFQQWKQQREKAKQEPKMVVLGANGKPVVEEEEKTNSIVSHEKSLTSKYHDWDLWEPSSEDESANDVPQPDHPEFAAMKADMEAREARKKAARVVSEKENEHGNAAVKQKDYLKAIEHYTNAIQNTRGEKSYYTNRALCYIHTFNYEAAIKDCENALNIFECFEEEHVRYTSDYKNMKIVLKAYLRVCKAHLGLNNLPSAITALSKATKLISDIYQPSTRKSEEYQKAQKAELAEVEKLRKEIQEKEKFRMEEEKLAKQSTTAALAVSTPSATKADASTSDSLVHSINASSASSAVSSGPADTASVQALVSSLQSAHASTLASSASGTSDTPAPSLSWSALSPALAFLSLSLETEGNKDRVCTHPPSRVCIDAVMRIIKAADPASAKASNLAFSVGAPTSLPSTLPNFVPLTTALAPRSNTHAATSVAWRETGGFQALGAFLNSSVGVLLSAGVPPLDTIRLAMRVLLLIADREQGREYLSSQANSGAIVATVLRSLDSNDSAFQTTCLNLLADLSFQPSFRTWLASPPQAGLVDKIYSSILSISPSQSSTALSAGLAAIINLLGSTMLRAKFVESGASVEQQSAVSPVPASSPITLIVTLLDHLSVQWTKEKFLISGTLSELSEKALAIALNLTVDLGANVTFFTRVLSSAPKLLERIIQLVAQPASTSAANTVASESSTRSSLSPVLIERSLGVLTRGLRREHNAATAPVTAGAPKPAQPAPRPLRKLLLDQGGVQTLVRILTLAPFAQQGEGEDVSAESVLAKLQQPVDETVSSSSPVPAPVAASSFRYTRTSMEHASVCLAVCMTQDPTVAQQVSKMTFQGVTAVQALVSLLSSPSKNIAGNACLCIDGLCTLPDMVTRPELSASLDQLLSILKDPACKSAHQNAAKAAILIGRAPNNVERWTKMRGVEIISTVLKMK